MAKKPTYFQERKAFLARMIKEGVKISYPREQKIAKDIFSKWPVPFLEKVKKPFEMESLAWFLSKDGERYLEIKLAEFNYNPQRVEIIPGDKKEGEEWTGRKKLTLRDFLS